MSPFSLGLVDDSIYARIILHLIHRHLLEPFCKSYILLAEHLVLLN